MCRSASRAARSGSGKTKAEAEPRLQVDCYSLAQAASLVRTPLKRGSGVSCQARAGMHQKGTPVFAYVITYDLRSEHRDAHSAFLRHAPGYGLSSWTDCGGEMVQLPNTTVTGSFLSLPEAEAAFDKALRAAAFELASSIYLVKQFIIPQGAAGVVLSDNKRPKVSLANLFSALAPTPATGPLSRLGSIRA